jgi:hypothetical protein
MTEVITTLITRTTITGTPKKKDAITNTYGRGIAEITSGGRPVGANNNSTGIGGINTGHVDP